MTADQIIQLVEAKGLSWVPKTEDEIGITCPNAGGHQGGFDTRPSFDINLNGRGGNCLACGYSMSADKMLRWLVGEDLDDLSLRSLAIRSKINRLRQEQVTKSGESGGEVFLPPGDLWEGDYRGVSANTLRGLGAIHATRGRYQNRIALPVYVKGKLVGIDARALGDEVPKYLRNKDSTCKEDWLFPYDVVSEIVKEMPREERYVIFGEGLFHALNGIDKGFPALCYFGSNNMSLNKLRMLVALGISEVIIFTDPDIAGHKAEQYIGAMLKDWVKVTVADTRGQGEGLDLGDYDAETIQLCIDKRYEPQLPLCMPEERKIEYGAPCKKRRCPFYSYGKCNNIVWLGSKK